MTEQAAPRIEVTIAASADAIWSALRDRERIRHWHGWEFGGLDQEIDEIYFTDVTEDAESGVLRLNGGDRIELTPSGSATSVVLTRADPGDDPDWELYYHDITEGWITFLHQLRFAVERHPGQARRTVFLGGDGTRAGSPIDELALAGVADQPAGSAYQADLLGERVTGTVWFRSDNQFGLTVDGWRDGLLVLSHVGPAAYKPKGAAMAIISTYGLDDTAHQALEQRWTPWWTKRYAGPA